jgi:hypothetical protein
MKRRPRRKMDVVPSSGAAIGAVALRRRRPLGCLIQFHEFTENYMYIGGGILGTILVVLLVLWLLGMV